MSDSNRVKGPCPFCHHRGGTIDCDFEGQVGGQPMLYHSLPTCPEYDRMSADEFVAAVIERRHLQ